MRFSLSQVSNSRPGAPGLKGLLRWFYINVKGLLIGLYFFEHLTFQATQIGKLAAHKVPKVEEGLSRTTRKRRKTGLKRAKNTHFAPKMHVFPAFFPTVEGAVVLRAGTAGWGQFLMRLFSIKPAFRSQVSVNARLSGTDQTSKSDSADYASVEIGVRTETGRGSCYPTLRKMREGWGTQSSWLGQEEAREGGAPGFLAFVVIYRSGK